MRILAFLAAFLAFTLPAAARAGFQGYAVISAVSGKSCAADGQAVGNHFTSFFLPAGLSDNGPDTYISLYEGRNATSFRFANSVLDSNSPFSTIYINSYGRFSAQPNGVATAVTVTPKPVASTPFVNVRMSVTNFQGTVGCTVTLEAAFVRRL